MFAWKSGWHYGILDLFEDVTPEIKKKLRFVNKFILKVIRPNKTLSNQFVNLACRCMLSLAYSVLSILVDLGCCLEFLKYRLLAI